MLRERQDLRREPEPDPFAALELRTVAAMQQEPEEEDVP